MADSTHMASGDLAGEFNLRPFVRELVDDTCGYVADVQTAMDIISRFEKSTTTKYTVQYCPRNFGNTNLRNKPHKILWEHSDILSFDGTPFMLLGTKVLECQHGPDRNVGRKRKYAEKAKETPFLKHRFLKHDTKKSGCQAQVKMYEIVRFPDHKIQADSRGRRTLKSAALRNALTEGTVSQEKRLYIKLPSHDQHSKHTTGEMGGLLQPIDNLLITRIYKLVGEGIRNVSEMKRHLKFFVEQELFRNQPLPVRNNRRYFPTLRTIKNHMYNATIKQRESIIDQENVEQLVDKCRAAGDRVLFRPFTREGDNSAGTDDTGTDDGYDDKGDEEEVIITRSDSLSTRLLFVHQTKWQARLLLRYGQEMAFLDATYKTTKYALPLYFVAVKTNVNYEIVAEFVVQDETTVSITEALNCIKQWNPGWKPRNIMTDLCEEEINAVENVFSDCGVLICTFHREQAWERWTAKKENGVFACRDSLLAKLRRIANSRTQANFDESLRSLRNSEEWLNHGNVQTWFNSTWLRHKKKWVCADRSQRLLAYVNTNNGLERQNGAFKHQYLCTLRKYSLGGMLKILVEEYLPDKYEMYIDANTRCSDQVRRYNTQIPLYLHNRPDYLVDHCLKRFTSAEEIDAENVKLIDQPSGCFHVKTANSTAPYKVCFVDLDQAGFPSCECMDWARWYLPCKHMLAIIQSGRGTWDQLPTDYRESPFLSLDEDIFFKTVHHLVDLNQENDEIIQKEPEPKVMSTSSSVPCLTQREPVTAPTRTQVIRCCDLLATIKNLVHEVVDESLLTKLEDELHRSKQDLEEGMQKDNGLVLSQKSTQPVNKERRKKRKRELPPIVTKPNARTKHPYSGRHGPRAAMMRTLFHTKMSVDELIRQSRVIPVAKPWEHTCGVSPVKQPSPPENIKPSLNQPPGMDIDIRPAEIEREVELVVTSEDMAENKSIENENQKRFISVQSGQIANYDMGKKLIGFTPPLKRGRLLVDPLLHFGPIKCSLLHIKSLEHTLSRGVLTVMRSVEPGFNVGWLFDAIIDAYFWCLQQLYQDTRVLSSTVMLVLQNGMSSSRVWKGEDLSHVDWVIAPWNPAGGHWTLVAVNIKERTITYLDPNQDVDVKLSIFAGLLQGFLTAFLKKHGWDRFTIISPKHSLQKDSRSCGVLVCWYARQLLTGKPLTDSIDVREMRVNIFETIRGDCLQRLVNPKVHLSVCPVCMDRDRSDPMVACTKCNQWYHCECLGTSVDEAEQRSILHCPPSSFDL